MSSKNKIFFAALGVTLAAATGVSAGDPTPFTGKAHILLVPDIEAPALTIGDRSRTTGLSVNSVAPDVEEGLGLEISGTTEAGTTYPIEQLDTKNFTFEGNEGELEFYAPPGCEDECDAGLLLSRQAGEEELYSSSYFITGADIYNENKTVSTVSGAGFAGQATGLESMTALKSGKVRATYEGSFLGLANFTDDFGAYTELVTGDVTLNADFKKGNVAGGVTGLTFGEGEDQGTIDQGLGLKAKIKGNEYSGTVSITKGTGAAKGGGTVSKSALNGGFFGFNASETAGALRVEGTLTPTVDGVSITNEETGAVISKMPVGIVGSFGARAPALLPQ
jgi:hypothetical protein